MKRYAVLACASLFALALTACQKEDAAGESPAAQAKATSNPADAITAAAQKLKEGDVLAVVQLSVPPARYEKLKTEWKAKMAEDPPSEEDKLEFQAMMTKLTAPDAENTLMAEAEPELAKFDTEIAPQLPMWIGMGQGFAMQSVNANADMTPEQKKQASDVITAMVAWLQGVKLSDRALVKQAIGEAVETARAIDLKTLDEARALEFEPAMAKFGIAFEGVKDILKVYGLDLNQTFDSVKASVVSETGDTAKVKVDYTLFGQQLSTVSDMVKIDDRWYGKDTIAQIEKELAPAPADAAPDAMGEPMDDAAPLDGQPEAAPADAATQE
ncbi:hypothetical protein [Chiayiivirga flava]|uniref:Uncharacterized protein n=1 Tax=Chiayiivirga flava TaxID=659595 RepID=A0A7W8D7Z0_9GAMM|nr:hypothetical protein [Chiayiivirga flava]MBB5209594.1 hypothetical protein [Chiayiivirga flava]